MRDRNYKKYDYRLHEDTVARLNEEKIKSGVTFNLFFRKLLDCWEEYGNSLEQRE